MNKQTEKLSDKFDWLIRDFLEDYRDIHNSDRSEIHKGMEIVCARQQLLNELLQACKENGLKFVEYKTDCQGRNPSPKIKDIEL